MKISHTTKLVASLEKKNKTTLPATTNIASNSASQVKQSPKHPPATMASAHKEKAAGSSVTSNKTASSPSQVEQPSSQLTTTSKRETAKPFDLLFSLRSTLQTLSTQISTAQLSQADLNGILKSLHTGMAIVKEATSRSEFELFRKLPVELRLKVWRHTA